MSEEDHDLFQPSDPEVECRGGHSQRDIWTGSYRGGFQAYVLTTQHSWKPRRR
jgi:hypothetical protein